MISSALYYSPEHGVRGDHTLDEEDTASTHMMDDARVHLWSL